jgi:methionine-rich copper-binding protein CopC
VIRRVALLLLLIAVTAVPAQAHASLVSAVPAPGSTVDTSLKELLLTFDDALRPNSLVVLYTNDFQTVGGVESRVEDNLIRATLTQALPPATYTVQWAAVASDGHLSQGTYQFEVRAASIDPAIIVGGLIVAAGLIGLIVSRKLKHA